MMFLFATVLALATPDIQAPAALTPAEAVASIHAGHHDCPHCNLAGADLTNTCVKNGNLEGADFDRARAVLMCMSYADFKGATFRNADLSAANLAHANLDGADLTGADLTVTSLKGTDLTRVKGLTQAQLDQACGDAETKVPPGMKVKTCN